MTSLNKELKAFSYQNVIINLCTVIVILSNEF